MYLPNINNWNCVSFSPANVPNLLDPVASNAFVISAPEISKPNLVSDIVGLEYLNQIESSIKVGDSNLVTVLSRKRKKKKEKNCQKWKTKNWTPKKF